MRYLGLPGTDLIDLRYLHEQLCRDNNRSLCFLGFNTEAQSGSPAHVRTERLARRSTPAAKRRSEQSAVLPDDFRLIANSGFDRVVIAP